MLLLLSLSIKTCSFSTPAMDDPDDLLISEVDEELESALQQADRRALGDIDTNTTDAAASAPNAIVVQVCPARL